MYHFHLSEKNDNSLKIDPVCYFLTINFCENLLEYFFVQNHFLIIKKLKKDKTTLTSILF